MDFLRRTWAEIDISALKHNFEIIKSVKGESKIFAVVKADAYGHGATTVAPILQQNGADGFAVSNLDEALILRAAGIVKPILILGYTPAAQAKELSKNDIIQAIFSYDYAAELSENAKKSNVNVKVHIKLDTGMSRLGFDCRNEKLSGADEVISVLKFDNLIFDGVFTHFAVADSHRENDTDFTENQYERFCKAVEKIESSGIKIPNHHCCNSAASLLCEENHLSIIRPGIILYGLTPSVEMADSVENFKPVMTLKSVVSMVKTIHKGDTVSYGRTFTAEKDTLVATVTAGYADGYPRAMSNCGEVLIHGKRAKILGKVCMDQLVADVSDIENVKAGDEVILFGSGLPVEEIAEKAGTINYEIICGITGRVPRLYKK
ncbi:MAG: alanine racemase [Clostridiales bacterium]|nr:alanine racemase [Candidatus Equinaster intestinalis]